jgi:hypothetical protein
MRGLDDRFGEARGAFVERASGSPAEAWVLSLAAGPSTGLTFQRDGSPMLCMSLQAAANRGIT